MPKKRVPERAKPETARYVGGAIVAIVVLVAIILLLRGITKPAAPPAPAAPPVPEEIVPSEAPEKPPVMIVAEKPVELRYCAKEIATGYEPLGCAIANNVLTVTGLRNSGKVDLAGMWFYITAENGKTQYLKDSRNIPMGAALTYNIDLSKHEAALGAKISQILALPVAIQDGAEQVCLNQRKLIIKYRNCV